MTEGPAAPQPRSSRLRAVWLVALAIALLGLGYYLSDVLNPFLIALLIAYILNPLVEKLERRGIGRRFAVSVLFGAVLVGIVVVLSYSAFKATEHITELRFELTGERILDPKDPNDRKRIEGFEHGAAAGLSRTPAGDVFEDEDRDTKRKVGLLELITSSLGPRIRNVTRAELESFARALESQAGQALQFGAEASRGLRSFLSGLGNFVGYVLLVPIYTFFLLLALSDLRGNVRALLPALYRERIVDIAAKIDHSVAAFFRGRLLIAIVKGLVTWAGLALAGVRFSFFIGMGAGILSVVPFLGPLVGGGLALVFAYESGESYGARCLGVALTFAAAEAVETVAYPVVIGRETGLHPVVLILSLFVFGKLFGLFGVLLAVPIACVLKILFVELVLPELRAMAAEPPPP